MAHTCHAAGCSRKVPPVMFMCKRHWFMLTPELRAAIWRTYRPGQCDDWKISQAYADAATAAVRWLGQKEDVLPALIDEAVRVYRMLAPEPSFLVEWRTTSAPSCRS